MWVGTFNGGVNWVDYYEKSFRTYNHFPNSPNGISENL